MTFEEYKELMRRELQQDINEGLLEFPSDEELVVQFVSHKVIADFQINQMKPVRRE